MGFLGLCLCVAVGVGPMARAAAVDFEQRVLPVLQKKCFECHGSAKAEAGLRLDGAQFIQKGGASGPALVPGDPDASLMYSRVDAAAEHAKLMSENVTALERAFLKRWIADGGEFGSWVGSEGGGSTSPVMAETPAAEPPKTETDAKPATEPMPATEPRTGATEVAMVPKTEPPPSVTPPPTSPPTSPPAALTVNFERQVLPILQSKCFECHKAPYEEGGRVRKPKAELRLDAARGILQGSGNGPVVVSRDPEASTLYQVVTLPPDDDDVMPPKGDGTPLTPAEQEVLKTWIAEGTNFSGWIGNEEGLVQKVATPSDGGPSATDLLAQQVKGASAEALSAVASTGALITQVAIGNPLLRVEYVTEESKIGDEEVMKIAPLAANVTELDLSETRVTDAALKMLGTFDKLTFLDLHSTEITDATIEAMKDLRHLEYLNLYGTGVTDASLPTIAAMKKLKAVYLWKTGVTEDGAKKLRQALPGAKINL